MMAGDSKGAFITFEGGEGSGKSTVCTRVFDAIKEAGYRCWKGSEPGGTVHGKSWRDQILSPTSNLSSQAELFLFLADRAQNFAENVNPRLAEGCVVMLDRHRDSTAAYQGGGRGHDMGLVDAGNDHATTPTTPTTTSTTTPEPVRPDLTILLDIDPKAGLLRSKRVEYGAADRIEAESLDFHTRIRKAFIQIAETEPGRFVVLDASRPLEEIVADAVESVEKLLLRKGVALEERA